MCNDVETLVECVYLRWTNWSMVYFIILENILFYVVNVCIYTPTPCKPVETVKFNRWLIRLFPDHLNILLYKTAIYHFPTFLPDNHHFSSIRPFFPYMTSSPVGPVLHILHHFLLIVTPFFNVSFSFCFQCQRGGARDQWR